MSRVAKGWDWDKKQKDQLERLTKNITIGTPAKYRKWYTDRKGVFDD